jgi:lipopolysaccharide export system protein LptA
MDETFTTTLNVLTNKAKVNEELQENLEGDELMFYLSLRADLNLLKKNPKVQTVHQILDYSKSLR